MAPGVISSIARDDVVQAACHPPDWPAPRILIAGMGNLLMGDDGVGVHIVRCLPEQPCPGALAVEIGVAALDAAHWLAWADGVVAIDAMRAGGAPGSVYQLDAPDATRGAAASLHDLSLFEALRLVPAADRPIRAVLIGVEPERVELRIGLSTRVSFGCGPARRAVLHAAVQMRAELLTETPV
jgi:hydrogenase maturation protease